MNPRYLLRKSFIALLIVCVLPSLAAAQMPDFDSLYVFGDSLADNGNILIQSESLGVVPPVPPSAAPHRTYFAGRFSNGYVEFEYLWQMLTGNRLDGPHAMKPFVAAPYLKGAGAVDFAYGGTGTAYIDETPGGMPAPGLKGQIELFRRALNGKKPSERALYAIATGSNDYRADEFNEPMNPNDVVQNIKDGIVTLYGLGARDVVVLDMPNLGLIPANAFDPDPNVALAATAVSNAHNAVLNAMLVALQTELSELHLISVKLDPLFYELLGQLSPAPALAVASKKEASACLFIDPSSCPNVAKRFFNMPLGFLFWDVVHPTTEAHHALAEYVYQQLVDSYK